jgi:hypothetical protein
MWITGHPTRRHSPRARQFWSRRQAWGRRLRKFVLPVGAPLPAAPQHVGAGRAIVDEGTCGPGANRAAGGRGKAHPVAPPNPFRLLGQCRAPLPPRPSERTANACRPISAGPARIRSQLRSSQRWPGNRSAPIYRTSPPVWQSTLRSIGSQGSQTIGQISGARCHDVGKERDATPGRGRSRRRGVAPADRSSRFPCVNAPCRRCSGVPPSSSLAFARPGSCASCVQSRSGRSQPTASWIPARSISRSTLSLCLMWQAQPIGVLWYTSSRNGRIRPRGRAGSGSLSRSASG